LFFLLEKPSLTAPQEVRNMGINIKKR